MSEKTMNVIVHKAKITLKSNESIDDFVGQLSKACREHIKKTLGIGPNSPGGCWPVETYSDVIVMSAYKGNDDTKYYSVPYKRTAGGFEFGQSTEVVRSTTFKPASSFTVVKKNDGTYDGWEKTEKSIWEGIL